MPESSGDATWSDNIPDSKSQSTVLVTATGTTGRIVLPPLGVNRVTTDAVKYRFTSFRLKSSVIAVIIVDPQHKEEDREKEAVNQGASGEIEHAEGEE